MNNLFNSQNAPIKHSGGGVVEFYIGCDGYESNNVFMTATIYGLPVEDVVWKEITALSSNYKDKNWSKIIDISLYDFIDIELYWEEDGVWVPNVSIGGIYLYKSYSDADNWVNGVRVERKGTSGRRSNYPTTTILDYVRQGYNIIGI